MSLRHVQKNFLSNTGSLLSSSSPSSSLPPSSLLLFTTLLSCDLKLVPPNRHDDLDNCGVCALESSSIIRQWCTTCYIMISHPPPTSIFGTISEAMYGNGHTPTVKYAGLVQNNIKLPPARMCNWHFRGRETILFHGLYNGNVNCPYPLTLPQNQVL